MRFIMIDDNECLGKAWIKIKNDMDNELKKFSPASAPYLLFSGRKILPLRKFEEEIVRYKIEGPGFLVDEIYRDFLNKEV